MAQPRNLQAEQKYVDQFFKSQGKAPSTPEDWKSIHTAAYGTDLPSELKTLPMYQTGTTSALPPAPTAGSMATANPTTNSNALNYMGADISDSALGAARTSSDSYNTSGFLDQVKSRLQQKFKPETEVLGLGSFAATLGPLDPSGVMAGINEQSGKFRKKGALALQALSTANDIYSEQARLAASKLDRLEGLRDEYEKTQKEVEGDAKAVALLYAQKGSAIPDDILNLLPSKMREAYKQLHLIYQDTPTSPTYDVSSFSGGGSDIANAIKTIESNGNYDARGADGEIGAYQIMPGNYVAWAKEAGVDPTDYSPEAQDKVANYKINQYYAKYNDPVAVALAWNAGPGVANEYAKTDIVPKLSGTSAGGGAYNVQNYVSKFSNALGLTAKATTKENPLTITEVAKYNELYPDAGILPSDTPTSANSKIAVTNSPEARAKSLIEASRDQGDKYEDTVKEINDGVLNGIITDKVKALEIAKEVYGESVDGGSIGDITNELPQFSERAKRDFGVVADIASQTRTGKLIKAGADIVGTVPSLIDSISDYLFAK